MLGLACVVVRFSDIAWVSIRVRVRLACARYFECIAVTTLNVYTFYILNARPIIQVSWLQWTSRSMHIEIRPMFSLIPRITAIAN